MYQGVLLILQYGVFFSLNSKYQNLSVLAAILCILDMFIRDFECLKLSHINHQKENHGSTIYTSLL